jgi:hypothetical protein
MSNEFCDSCGAGIAEFRREGEGTCERCEWRVRTNDWYISRRIATPDGSYPFGEALYSTVEEYLEIKERNWEDAKERADLIISRLAGELNELSND